LAFLQTIIVPVYGTNGPLWSLANEFWYYVLFPLMAEAMMRRGPARWPSTVLFTVCAWALPAHILLPGSIWLLGCLSWRLSREQSFAGVLRSVPWIAASGTLLAATLAASKTAHWLGSDYSIGVASALFVAGLGAGKGLPRLAIFARLSELSYTLYLTHFPVLAFLWFVLLAPRRFQPDPEGYAVLIIAVASAIGFAMAAWWCFERNTERVRRALWTDKVPTSGHLSDAQDACHEKGRPKAAFCRNRKP
jgi:peptidoglycan/LPS O-acetylase OafA/YrhL